MKEKIYILMMAAATLCSCSSEQFNESSGGDGEATEFSAVIEGIGDGVSRTSLNSTTLTPEWIATTDIINIGGAEYTAQTSGSKTTFKGIGAAKGADGKYHAYYPATMNNGGNIILPSRYTYTEGQCNLPLYAESETTTLSFQNICGVVAVKVTSEEMSSVDSITVTSDKTICGTCTITANESGKYYASATETASAENQTVTLCCSSAVTPKSEADGGTMFYIPLPVISGAKLYVMAYGDVNATKAASYSPFIFTQSKAYKNVAIARNKIYNRPFATSLAAFSVSADLKVRFTNGNIYSDTNASTATASNLHFESSQIGLDFDYVSGTTSYTRKADHVGHFYWNSTIGASVVDSYTNDGKNTFFAASNITVAGTSGLRVLTGSSSGEWHYLLNDRTNASNLRKYNVTITDGTLTLPHCLVIAPDNFAGTLASTYTVQQLKEYSLVCLPNAGRRMGATIDRLDDDGYGGYSSSTPLNSDKFWSLWFTTTSITDDQTYRTRAFNVRLVHNVQNTDTTSATDPYNDGSTEDWFSYPDASTDGYGESDAPGSGYDSGTEDYGNEDL